MNNKKKEPATLHAIDFEIVSSPKKLPPGWATCCDSRPK